MSFNKFEFDPKIVAGIETCGYKIPTPIQEQAIPEILKGRDIMGLAQTGTGKTAAFVLPILQKLLAGPRRQVRAVIVAPTRELAEQINDNICEMGRNTGLRSVSVYGGVSKHNQIKMFKTGIEIVVACPGRLLDHLDNRDVDLSGVEMLVLDEADMMFDMGFMPAIRRLMKFLPKQRQNLLFSATMPGEIRHLADSILKDPIHVQINHAKPVGLVSHKLYRVEKHSKAPLLKKIMKETEISSALVFTRTKYAAKKLAINLEKDGHRAVALQGNMTQNRRKEAMEGFRQGKYNVLVATDIAARGIDVSGISHVINFDVPDTVEAYTHRTGRTGRADRTGVAFTFATGEDSRIIQLIEQTLDKKMVLLDTGVLERSPESSESRPAPEGRRNGRPAGAAGKKQAGGAPAGQNVRRDSDGGRPRKVGPSKAGKGRQGRRSAPLGVDFLNQPRRTAPRTGGNVA
jgi:ATP-dependent RNA helicase RhlE